MTEPSPPIARDAAPFPCTVCRTREMSDWLWLDIDAGRLLCPSCAAEIIFYDRLEEA